MKIKKMSYCKVKLFFFSKLPTNYQDFKNNCTSVLYEYDLMTKAMQTVSVVF